MSIFITFLGSPLSTQHLYKSTCRGKFPVMYMAKEGKDLKESYQLLAKNQYKGEVMSTECDMKIALHFPDKRRRDIDNYNKLVLDSLEGIVYKDDKQIRKLTIEKHISPDNPRVEVEIKFK